jgi:hypothetical protein
VLFAGFVQEILRTNRDQRNNIRKDLLWCDMIQLHGFRVVTSHALDILVFFFLCDLHDA